MKEDGAIEWVWLRHAPACVTGRFCGQSDPALAPLPDVDYRAVVADLPRDATLFVSPLKRTRETADRLCEAGLRVEKIMTAPLLMEQNFGVHEGQPYESVTLPGEAEALAQWKPQDGESFADVVVRVRDFLRGARDDLSGAKVLVVGHAGVIRAALTVALGISPARGLAFAIEPLSATAMTQSVVDSWQVHDVNRRFAEHHAGPGDMDQRAVS